MARGSTFAERAAAAVAHWSASGGPQAAGEGLAGASLAEAPLAAGSAGVGLATGPAEGAVAAGAEFGAAATGAGTSGAGGGAVVGVHRAPAAATTYTSALSLTGSGAAMSKRLEPAGVEESTTELLAKADPFYGLAAASR